MRTTSEMKRVTTLWWAASLVGLMLSFAPRAVVAGTVTTTTVADTVYRADGTVASGTLIVSWPAFSTAAGGAVAAGTVTVPINADGTVSLSLAPNVGASPAGTYYTAVYHLTDGTVSKEFWLVPQAATTTIAAIRTQVVPAAVAMQTATKSYVDSVVNSLSGSFLALSGGTMTGPVALSGDPAMAAQAATKHYVDTAVAGVTSESIGAVPVAGGTMTGPLTLSGDPVAAEQAATKNYVDAQAAVETASVNTRVAKAGDTMTGPLQAPVVNHIVYADQYPTVQAAVSAACATNPVQEVVIPGSTPVGTTSPEFTNPCNAPVVDQRQAHMDIFEARAYGALCDGAHDDTAAVQAAINAAAAAVNGPGARLVRLPAGVCSFNVTDPGNVSIEGANRGGVNGSTLVTNANGGQSPIITVAPGAGNIGIRDLTLAGAGTGQFATAQSMQRSQGVVTVTLAGAAPASIAVGRQVNIAGTAPVTSFNGQYTVTSVSGNTFTYSQAAAVVNCTFATATTGTGTAATTTNTATCTTASSQTVNGQTTPRWLGQGWGPGTPITIVAGSGASAFTASGTVTTLGSGNFPDTAGQYPVTFTATITASSGTFTTANAMAYPSDAQVAMGQASAPGCPWCNSAILSEQRTNNVLSVHLATGSGGWPGAGGQVTISGAGDPSMNGVWNVAQDPDVGHGYIFLTNSGPDTTVALGTVGALEDIGISIPNGTNISIERVFGSNFGEGFIDWEAGERLYLNFVQADTCLQDVNQHVLVPLPVNGPGFDQYPQWNPMGCVVLNGTDGYMQFSEISTGSWNPFGNPSQTSVVSGTLPSKAIVVGFGGVDNWLDSNIGEISDEGLWNGGEFSRIYANRFDLNAGTGMENNGNQNLFVGNTVLHDNRDQVVNKGNWYGIDETGQWGGVAGGNVWSGNNALSSNGLCDIHDGLTSGSAPPNQWQGNQGSTCAPAGYSGSFAYGESDFNPQSPAADGTFNVNARKNWHINGNGTNQTIGDFTNGTGGQTIRVLTDGSITFSGDAGGYGIRTCSGYGYTPPNQLGTATFTLQGEYVQVWQENCDQVAGYQIEPHMSLALEAIGPSTTWTSLSGAAGSATYAYECVGTTRQGTETTGTPVVVTNGPATLSASNGINVWCGNSDPGVTNQHIYRVQAPAGSGLQTGLVAVGSSFTDTGAAVLNTNMPPSADHTADITTPDNLSVGATATVKTLVVQGAGTPASSATSCTPGALWADDSYVYHCSADGATVKRAALGTF